MRYVGFMVGLIVGAMIGSVWGAILFAFLGAYAGAKWFEQKPAQDVPHRSDNTPNLAEEAIGTRSTADLIRRIVKLEMRVETLELKLAEGEVLPPDMQASALVAINPVPTPTPALAPMPVIPPVPVPAPMPAAVVAAPQATVAAQPPRVQPLPQPKPVPVPPPPPPIPLRDRLPKPIAQLIFGGNMLVKVGALILFLGLAFLLRYTAERVTVPIEMRYASVVLVATALLALGWFLRRRRPDYAIVIQGAGIGVFYLTTLAAMKLHGLLPVTAGFGFLFAVAVLSAVLAVLQNAPVLAIVAALEGFAAPVLASTGQNNPVGLFSYLLVLDIGILLVAWFKAWRVLNLIGAVGTFSLAVGWAQKYYTNDQFDLAQPFLVVFFLLFIAIGFLFARRTLSEAPDDTTEPLSTRAVNTLRRVGRVDSALTFGLPMAAYGLEYLMVKPWDMGPAFAAMGFSAFYLLAGRLIWATQPRGLSLLAEAYAIVGVIFATLAIPLAFEGQWTGAAWAVEAAGMYWLGVRQQRPYARAFSFAIFAGAVFKLLEATHLDGASGHALLDGSLIGPVLVAAGAFAMWAMHRRGKLDAGEGIEAFAGLCLPWLGMASLTLLLWQSFLPTWAAMATAVLASVAFALAIRLGLATLVHTTYGLQALAVTSFIANLHRGNGEQVLASGWDGMIASLVIAASVLSSVAFSMRKVLQDAQRQDAAPDWSDGNIVAVVTGVALLHLSTLFQINLQQAAMLWPLSASLMLWIALRIGHPALAMQSALIYGVSAVLYWTHRSSSADLGTFSGLSFWSAVVIGVAALWCGDQLRGTSRTRNPWAASSWVLWLPVVWGLFWLQQAVLSEASRALLSANMPIWIASVQMAIALVVSALSVFVAGRRSWMQLARSTVVLLPILLMVTLAGISGWGMSRTAYVPSDGIGWLVWPLAVIWHLYLLQWQEKWFTKSSLAKLHIAGFWFFLLIAAREGQWLLGSLGDDWSSWSLLGWVLAPAVALWALQLPALLARWPLSQYRVQYANTAAYPVAMYLLLWAWVSNVAGSGNADPLPYVPLLNPLELAHWLILGALYAWWSRVGPGSLSATLSTRSRAVFGLTAFALLTGMVLRSCHHFAGVPWDLDALYASRLTQAALSITWALCGVALMVVGNAKARRTLWVAGATLLGIVVLKLFFIELADQGGLFRIVSFLSVGVMLLAVGYFAPVPPSKHAAARENGGSA